MSTEEVALRNGAFLVGFILLVILIKAIALIIKIYQYNDRIQQKLGRETYQWIIQLEENKKPDKHLDLKALFISLLNKVRI